MTTSNDPTTTPTAKDDRAAPATTQAQAAAREQAALDRLQAAVDTVRAYRARRSGHGHERER